MKQKLFKTMLLLCALVAGSTSVWGDEVTFDYSDYKGKGTTSTGSEYTMEKDDVSITETKFYCGSSASFAQFYASGLTTITPASGVTITGIVLTASSTDYNGYQSSGTITASTGSVSGSTSSTTVTWAGSATSAFTISHSKQIRWTSIVVTYTKSGSGSSGVATTTTINPSGITNTDVYTSTDAGSLSASVTVTAGGAAVPGANVTWTSSDTGVATIGETTGVVTLVAAGTTTITATYAGVVDTYQSSSATYNLTVTSSAPYVQPTEVEISLNNTFFGTSYSGSASGITDANPVSGTQDNITISYAGSGNHYINNSQIRFYPNNKLTFEAPSGYKITQIVFTSAGTWAATISANSGTYNSSTKTWTGSATSVLFTGSGSSRCDMSKATVTLAAAGKTTATDIDYSGITNTDVYVSTTAGTLTATVTPDGESALDSPTITWSSSDESVATIGETTGVVTLVAAGTTTITASYGGGATYAASSGTYVLTVTDSNPAIVIDLNNTFFGCSAFTTYSSGDPTTHSGTKDGVTVTYGKGSGSGYYINTSGIRLYDGSIFTISAPTGYVITLIELSGDTGFDDNLDYGATWTGTASEVTVGGNTNKKNMTKATVTLAPGVEVSAAGYTTYVTPEAVEFTGVTAYKVATINTTTLSLATITSAPANTPVIIEAAEDAYEFTPTGSPAAVGTNKLLASDGSVTGDGSTIFALGKKNGDVGFYLVKSGITVPAGKAYINTAAGVKEFLTFSFEDDADGLERVQDVQEVQGAIFNLAGQRLSKIQKGINIVNGKKILY